MARRGHPYLYSQLLRSQNIAQKCLCLTFAEYDTGKTGDLASATEMFDDGVGTEDVRCDIERVGTIDTVEFATVK